MDLFDAGVEVKMMDTERAVVNLLPSYMRLGYGYYGVGDSRHPCTVRMPEPCPCPARGAICMFQMALEPVLLVLERLD